MCWLVVCVDLRLFGWFIWWGLLGYCGFVLCGFDFVVMFTRIARLWWFCVLRVCASFAVYLTITGWVIGWQVGCLVVDFVEYGV